MNNQIGLTTVYSDTITQKLNHLLANYQIFYMNVRGFHWNVKGEQFFQLHTKFEELYTEVVVQIDEIAERILTLGSTPLHTFEDYLSCSEIKSSKNITEGKACVAEILQNFKYLLEVQREILEIAADSGDEGTASQMSDYITTQEKHVWMYNAFLG